MKNRYLIVVTRTFPHKSSIKTLKMNKRQKETYLIPFNSYR